MVVISVTQIHTGTVDNIIPERLYEWNSAQFQQGGQSLVKRRMSEIVTGHAASFGVEATLRYDEGYPAT